MGEQPGAEVIAVYQRSDGTCSLQPEYQGQFPYGFTTTEPDMAGVMPVLLASAIGPPEITVTRKGQFGVRHGSIYKVFFTYQEAHTFALTLSPLSPVKVDRHVKPAILPNKQVDVFPKQVGISSEKTAKIPEHVLKQVLAYTYTATAMCLQHIIAAYGTDGGPDWQEDMLKHLRFSIQHMLSGKTLPTPSVAETLITLLANSLAVGVEFVEKPDGYIPIGCDGLASGPTVRNIHAKKRRTIRKLAD